MSHRISTANERKVKTRVKPMPTDDGFERVAKLPCPSRYMMYPLRGRRASCDRYKSHRRSNS